MLKRLAIICGIMLLAGCAASRPAVTLPLPDDVSVIPPASGIPKNDAALSGVWAGTWLHPGGATFDAVLVVERLSPDEATIVYAWGHNADEPGAAGWTRVKAQVSAGPRLTWVAPNRTFIFSLNKSGNAILGTVRIGQVQEEEILMTRVPDQKWPEIK